MTGKGRGRTKKVAPPPANHGNTLSRSGTVSENSNKEDSNSGVQVVQEEGTPKAVKVEKPKFGVELSTLKSTPMAPEENATPNKLWVDVISGNRNPSNGMQVEFVAPQLINGEIEVAIEEEDIIYELRYWNSALIMYMIGSDLSMNTVK